MDVTISFLTTAEMTEDHKRQAEYAWKVHVALIKAEARDPKLSDNPRWRLLRMDAYVDFHNLLASDPDAN